MVRVVPAPHVTAVFGAVGLLFQQPHGGSWVLLALLCGFLSDTTLVCGLRMLSISSANASLTLQAYVGSTPVGPEISGISASGGNIGNLFRYDSVDKQYIYNLSNIGLGQGRWQLRVNLDDGTTKTTFIDLK
jgi:hypothetical protein